MDEWTTLEAIRSVKARYCRFLDTKDWSALGALFTDDAVLDVRADTGLDPIVGRDALIDQIRQAVVHARTAHQVHNPEIALGAGEAHVLWAMQDRVVWEPGRSPLSGVASITGYGHYHERYVGEGAAWRIASLRLTRLHVDMHRDG